MINKWWTGKDSKGSGHNLIKEYSATCLRGISKTTRKKSRTLLISTLQYLIILYYSLLLLPSFVSNYFEFLLPKKRVKSTPQVDHALLSKFSPSSIGFSEEASKIVFFSHKELKVSTEEIFCLNFSYGSEIHTVTGCRNRERFISLSYNIKICVSYSQISRKMVTKCSIL
jgi:hypothetical protein